MKTIKVTNKMYNFLMELSTELNTQNHRLTAMPYFFQIQTDEEIFMAKGQGEAFWMRDGDVLKTNKEIKETVISLKEWEEINSGEADILFDKLSIYDIEIILEEADYQEININVVKRYENAFFSEIAEI